jgi:signal peptidase I
MRDASIQRRPLYQRRLPVESRRASLNTGGSSVESKRCGRVLAARRVTVWSLLFALTLGWTILILAVVLAASGQLMLYRITSASMEPLLNCAGGPECRDVRPDAVLVSSVPYWFRKVRRRDIVVLRAPADNPGREFSPALIKRIVGLPGEQIEGRGSQLFVNGRVLEEPYVRPENRDHSHFGRLTLASGTYFVLGDNRKLSRDSRSFGVVPRSAIIGMVVLRYAPRGRIGVLADAY